MALPNAWTTINVGDEIEYDDHLTDLRANADYLDDNLSCYAYDSTFDGTNNGTIDSDKDNTINGTADVPYHNNLHSTVHNSKDTGVNGAKDTSYNGTRYDTVHYPRYLTRYATKNQVVHTYNYSSNNSKN